MLWLRTAWNQVDGQVVDIGVAVGGGVCVLESDVLTCTCILVEVNFSLFPSGDRGCRWIDGVHGYEGAGISRVGHHTYNQHVGRVSGSVHKGSLQGVDRNRGIKRRCDSNVVSAGRTCVEIEGSCTGIVGGVTVWSVGRVGVDLAPAERVCAFSSTVGVEVFRVWKLVNGIAFSCCGEY